MVILVLLRKFLIDLIDLISNHYSLFIFQFSLITFHSSLSHSYPAVPSPLKHFSCIIQRLRSFLPGFFVKEGNGCISCSLFCRKDNMHFMRRVGTPVNPGWQVIYLMDGYFPGRFVLFQFYCENDSSIRMPPVLVGEKIPKGISNKS